MPSPFLWLQFKPSPVKVVVQLFMVFCLGKSHIQRKKGKNNKVQYMKHIEALINWTIIWPYLASMSTSCQCKKVSFKRIQFPGWQNYFGGCIDSRPFNSPVDTCWLRLEDLPCGAHVWCSYILGAIDPQGAKNHQTCNTTTTTSISIIIIIIIAHGTCMEKRTRGKHNN